MITKSSLRHFFLLLILIGLSFLIFTNLYFIIDAILGSIILAFISVKPIQYLIKKKLKRVCVI